MTRGVGRAGSTGLLAALAAIVWLALFYGLNPDLVVDFDTAPPSPADRRLSQRARPGLGAHVRMDR